MLAGKPELMGPTGKKADMMGPAGRRQELHSFWPRSSITACLREGNLYGTQVGSMRTCAAFARPSNEDCPEQTFH